MSAATVDKSVFAKFLVVCSLYTRVKWPFNTSSHQESCIYM